MTEYKTLLLNSVYRKVGETPNKFSVDLQNNYKIRDVRLKSLQTWNAVKPWPANGVDDLIYFTIGGNSYSAVVSQVGTWVPATFMARLQTALNSIGPTGFAVLYDTQANYYTITNATPFVINWSQATSANSLWCIFGANYKQDSTSTTSYVLPNCGNVLGYNQIFITSPQLANQKSLFNFGTVGSSSTNFMNPQANVLLTVPLNISYGGVINLYGGDYDVVQNLRGSNLQHIDINIVDCFGNNLLFYADLLIELAIQVELF